MNKGFTLIELIVVLMVLAFLSISLIPRIDGLTQSANIAATEKEMKEISIAIIGDSEADLRGFQYNMRRLPANLAELYTDPGGGYNTYTQRGWNGPYVDARDSNGNSVQDIREDAWGTAYVYNQGAGTLTSRGSDGAAGGAGPAADIVLNLN